MVMQGGAPAGRAAQRSTVNPVGYTTKFKEVVARLSAFFHSALLPFLDFSPLGGVHGNVPPTTRWSQYTSDSFS